MKDIIIIGAGVNGCFLAHDLCRYQLDVLVIEKGDDVASGTTMANSAIIHSGYDPLPESRKAYFNVRGNEMYDEICRKLDIPFHRIGSWTLAFSSEEMEVLKKLQERGLENGVRTTLLSKEEVLQKEPHISSAVYGALEAQSAGIINPFILASHLMEHALDNGVQLQLSEEVVDLKAINGGYQVVTNKAKYEARVVINVAGVNTFQITSLLEKPSYELEARKGEYYVLNHFDNRFLNHVLFTLPTAKGKGVLVSPTTSWNYLVGPSSELCQMDDTSSDLFTLQQVKAQALKMIPDLPFKEVIRVFAGVRPTISKHDFFIHESEINPGFIELAGIESPGLASAPALSEYVLTMLKKHFTFQEKSIYTDEIRPYITMKTLPLEEKKALIESNPRYGRIICRCEQVSEQEIRDLFHRSLVPHSIKAVKKRIRVGFGKCQGGMCQPLLIKIMAEELHCDVMDIRYDGVHSEVLKYSLKEHNDD